MKITQAEAQIMEVLWRADEPLAIEGLRAQLDEDWADGTVRAFMNRLLRKKAVAATKDGKRSLYRPLLERRDYVVAESETFLARVFQGEAAPLVAHFVKNRRLTPDDLRQLKTIIEDLEAKDDAE
jgi:predicted transcriptional regulator